MGTSPRGLGGFAMTTPDDLARLERELDNLFYCKAYGRILDHSDIIKLAKFILDRETLLNNKIERLEKALRFYADKENWNQSKIGYLELWYEKGERARIALENKSALSGDGEKDGKGNG